jgi:membrane protein YdbS with pleckstrin-like domain
MPNTAVQSLNTIGPLILIAVIYAIGVFAVVRWRLAETPQKRNWWGLRAAAVFALALFVTLNQYVLHLRWPR